MASEADQTLLATDNTAASDAKVASGVESDTTVTFSFSNIAAQRSRRKTPNVVHVLEEVNGVQGRSCCLPCRRLAARQGRILHL
jgi:hypothetical protein